MDYLELRQRLKEQMRERKAKLAADNSAPNNSIDDRKRKLPYDDNYGTFFGPSIPALSQRLTQQSKFPLLELLNSHGVKSQVISKAQMLKESRDYSFLSSDEAPILEAQSQAPKPPTQKPLMSKTKQPLSKPPIEKPLMSKSKQPLSNPPIEKPLMSKSKQPLSKPPIEKPLIKTKQALPKPPIQKPQRPVSNRGDKRPAKKKGCLRRCSDDGGEDAIGMIRQMFGYDPSKYGDGEDDLRGMEVSFDEINKEEKLSERYGRKEDAEQRRLIAAEAKAERLAKLKKINGD